MCLGAFGGMEVKAVKESISDTEQSIVDGKILSHVGVTFCELGQEGINYCELLT